MNARILLTCLLPVAALLPAARADIDVGITAEIRLGRALPPPPPAVVVVEEVGPPGPPPWARAHGLHRSYNYYYYPGYDVYYRPEDRVWFYLDGGSWRMGVQLPTSIQVDFGRSVSLTLDNDRPYFYHKEVVTYYPRNYFTKVKFKDGRDHRDHEERDRDDHDRGKGKGKKK